MKAETVVLWLCFKAIILSDLTVPNTKRNKDISFMINPLLSSKNLRIVVKTGFASESNLPKDLR